MSWYSVLLERGLMPVWYGLRGRRYGAYRRFLEQSQWWSPERLREFQWQELRRLLEVAFHHVPFYRERYAAAGARLEDIRDFEDFALLPAVGREDIRAYREQMRSAAWKGRLVLHATGGSSGEPTRFYITLDSYDWRCAASSRAYSWSGCRLGERTLYLWGAPVGSVRATQALKMRLFRWLRRELMINTFAQSEGFWDGVYQRALRFRPRYVVGYVSSLKEFSRYLQSRRLSVPGLRAVLGAAEPLDSGARRMIEAGLGAPLYNTYGSREFMSIAAECEHRRGLHVHAENLLVETVELEPGGPREILVTDLHNLGMPFIRYRIGDLGRVSDRKCPCGRGLPLLEEVSGRVLEILRTASGKVISPEFFPHLLKEIPEIREFQVRQERLDHIVLLMVLDRELSPQSRSLLEHEFQRTLGDAVTVELRRVDSIPRLPSGKRRVVVALEGDGR